MRAVVDVGENVRINKNVAETADCTVTWTPFSTDKPTKW